MKSPVYSLKPFKDSRYLSTEEALEMLEKVPFPEKPKALAPEQDEEPSPEPAIIPPAPSSADIASPQNYLILDSHTYGSYSYPDLLVAKSLSHHGKNWYDSHAALHAEGFEMLTPRQFVDFLNLLKSKKAFDGKGNKVSSSELETLLKEIIEQRDPWRAERLDAKFENKKGRLHINYEHRTINGKLTAQKSEPLADYLAADKAPSIDLDDYLKRATSQGMPPADAKSGSLYYWSPVDGGVAGFRADAVWVCLNGGGDPRSSVAALGVRRRRAKNF